MIRSATLRTSGAAQPSGLDALGWRRLCTSFKSASLELCNFLASAARHASVLNWLIWQAVFFHGQPSIALNKNPGVRHIGIGDTARRIITKAIMNMIRQDIQEAAGSVQLCAGQISGIEAAIHTCIQSASSSRGMKLKPSC